jgi:two-component system, sensor histidine kinase
MIGQIFRFNNTSKLEDRIKELEFELALLKGESSNTSFLSNDAGVFLDFKKVIHLSGDGIIVLHDHKVLYMNEVASSLAGEQPLTDHSGKHLFSLPLFSHPHLQALFQIEDLHKLPETGELSVEWKYRTPEGKKLFLDIRVKAVTDECFNYHVVELRDISKSKRNEQIQSFLYQVASATFSKKDLRDLLRVIRVELDKILDTTNFYVALYNREEDTISLAYMADSEDEFETFPAGRTLTGYVIRTQKALLASESMLEELEKKGEIELIGTNSKMWLGVPLRNHKEVIGMLGVQSYTDPEAYSEADLELLEYISIQIGTAIERKQSETAIRDSEDVFRKAFHTSPDALCITTIRDGLFVNTNQGFSRMTGYTRKDLLDLKVKDLNIWLNQSDRKEFFKRILQRGSVSNFEAEFIMKNGTIRAGLISGRLLKLKDEPHVLSIIRDIHDLKQAQIKLREAKDKAEESDRLKTAFLANMSHEIRTPLNAITGFANILVSNDLSSGERKDILSVIQTSSDSLLNIIDDIIDISKMEAGELKIQYGNCNLVDLLKDIFISLVSRKAIEKPDVDIRMIMPPEDKELYLVCDPQRIRQVLINLTGNALKFTEKGYVEFGYERIGRKFLQFRVKDTGIGIKEDQQKLIFDRFRQADDTFTKKYRGTGLGLTISKNLVELMGGKIWLESERNMGSTFYFTLPLIPPGQG